MTGKKIILIGILAFTLLLGVCFGTLAVDGAFNQWTVTTLKEYVDQRFTQLQLAVEKAEQATEKRFEGVNEFRLTLSDQQRTFLPRAEYESGHNGLHTEVTELKERLDKIESMKSGGNVVWAYVLSAVSLIVAIFSIRNNILRKW